MGRLDDIAARNKRGYRAPARREEAPAPGPDPELAPGKRLENIVARNRHRGWPRERMMVMLMMGLALLGIISLMLFTDLGVRDAPVKKPAQPQVRDRANDIKLRSAPTSRPPPPATPATR